MITRQTLGALGRAASLETTGVGVGAAVKEEEQEEVRIPMNRRKVKILRLLVRWCCLTFPQPTVSSTWLPLLQAMAQI